MKRILALLTLFLASATWALDLRQSTAVTIEVGPFVDYSDGVTPETGLGLADDIEVSKAGAPFATVSSASLTHDSEGFYRWDVGTGTVDTLGPLVIKSVSSGVHVPVWLYCEVLPSNVWDSLYSTDKLQVDVTQVSGTSEDLPTATNLQTVDDNVDAVKAKTDNLTFTGTDLQVTLDGETVTPGADSITASVIAADAIGASELAANSITASEVADGAIDAGAIATDAITAAKIAADAIGASELATNAIGSSEIASNAITAAKLATDSITSDEIGATAVTEIQSGLGTSANQTTIISNIGTVDTVVDGIQTDLDNATDGLGALKTLIDAAQSSVDGLNDISTGDVLTQVASALATFWTSPATLVDLFFDEALSGHTTAGTAGKALSDAGSAGDPWSTSLPGAYGAGSAGYILGTNLDATVSSRSSHSAGDVWASGTRTLTDPNSYKADVSSLAIEANVETHVTNSLGAYDPPTKNEMDAGFLAAEATPEAILVDTDKLLSVSPEIELDGSVYRLTTNALEQAPAGGSVDYTTVEAVLTHTTKLISVSPEIELDGSVYRFTTNALEQGPSGDISGVGDWTATEKKQIRSAIGINGASDTAYTTDGLLNQMWIWLRSR